MHPIWQTNPPIIRNHPHLPFWTLLLIFIKQIRYMTNLLVATNNQDERVRLEEEFPLEDRFFKVPKNESGTLEALFRSISFEYFQNSPPQIVQKIISFAENAINSVCSLDLLREIIAQVKIQRDSTALYHKYFTEIAQEIGDFASPSLLGFAGGQEGGAQGNDTLFDMANRGQMRLTRTLDCYDLQQEYDLNIKAHCPLAISEKTQLPSIHGINPEEMDVEEDSKTSYILGSAEHYYGVENEWWKQDKHSNDSSKEISRFDCKAGNPLLQKSIGKLVVQEFRYDLNREMELARDINKHQEVQGFKYKKMMKDKLLNAKLKKRRKK